MTDFLMNNFLRNNQPRSQAVGGANYGTPYQPHETPLGENLKPGEVPRSLRKTFRHHPEIAALSFLPDQRTFRLLNNDIAINGIQTPIVLWRNTRTTTDERTITEYFIVDGYLRMEIAERIKIYRDEIPWIVDESIHSLQDALNSALKRKSLRAHYNECEHKYMIGLRYLQEKKLAGGQIGNTNNLNGRAGLISNDNSSNENDEEITDVVNVTTSVPDSNEIIKPSRVSEIIGKEVGLSEVSVRRYSRSAEQLEIAVDAIQRRWEVSRARAVRCCTQIHLVKHQGDVQLDARLVTAGDWARLKLQPDCMDRFPLTLDDSSKLTEKDKLHYHDEREQAIIAAVRELITPPRMRGDIIDAEYVEVKKSLSRNDPNDKYAHLKINGILATELCEEQVEKDPEFAAIWQRMKDERYAKMVAIATTDPDKEERLAALQYLAFGGQPLPTDELDADFVETIRRYRTNRPERLGRGVALNMAREKFPLEPDWEDLFDSTKALDKTLREYRDTIVKLEADFRKVVQDLHIVDDKVTRGQIDILSSWQSPDAKKLKETFLEIAKILADTNANHQAIVVNRDTTIHQRSKYPPAKPEALVREPLKAA